VIGDETDTPNGDMRQARVISEFSLFSTIMNETPQAGATGGIHIPGTGAGIFRQSDKLPGKTR
jgi:hypothetical protein